MHRVIVIVLFAFLGVSTIRAAERLEDPYHILTRHIEAIGGLEKVKAEKSSHLEGTLVIEGTGIQGTVKHWRKYPGRSRVEIDLTVFQQTQGDDGLRSWLVDTNGKVQYQTSEAVQLRRQVALHDEDYEYLDRASQIFTLQHEGLAEVEGQTCYVLKKSNSLNQDFSRLYISTDTFYLLKVEEYQPDQESHTYFSDYRPVNGVQHAFLQRVVVPAVNQKQTISVTGFEVNPDLDDSLFSAPVTDTRDFIMPAEGRSENVPFQFIENHIFIKVLINCRESLWVLDSGAGQSVIDRGYARELGLETSGSLQGQGAGNTVDFAFVTLPEFECGGIRFRSQRIVSIELRSMMKNAFGFEFDGILGFDFLSRFVTRIDFARELISFYEPENFHYTGNGSVLEFELRSNLPIVTAQVDKQYSGRWVLDLGAGDISFHYPFAQAQAFHERPGREYVGLGAGGHFHLNICRFDTIEFGGFIIEKPIISFPKTEIAGAFSSEELIGNLGNSLFKNFVLYLDYAHQHIILEKGENFGKPMEMDRSGMQINLTESGQIEIFFVSPGSSADKAGFLKGDLITALNQIDIRFLDGIMALRALFRETGATCYQVTVKRGDEYITLPLQLEMVL
ncbi:aspartyl protease family protein [bacterium]|nr:aspartyl protease family protein [bacterium]